MPREGQVIERAVDKRYNELQDILNRTDEEREQVMLEREKDNLMKPIKKQLVHEIKRIMEHGDKKEHINTKSNWSSKKGRHKSWNKGYILEDSYLDGHDIQGAAENFYKAHKGQSIYDLEVIGEKVFDYNEKDFVMLNSGPETGGRRRRRRRKSRKKRRKSRRKSRRKNKSRRRRKRSRKRRR